jgi:putative ABC transport system permease protein
VPTEVYLSTVDAEFDRLTRLALLAILGMAVAYTAVSVVNTQLMATAGRARELATLRLVGATHRQVLRIVGREAAVVTAIGALLGAAATVATLAAVTVALGPIVSAVPISVPWLPIVGITIACGLIALLASLIPVMRDPADARF